MTRIFLNKAQKNEYLSHDLKKKKFDFLYQYFLNGFLFQILFFFGVLFGTGSCIWMWFFHLSLYHMYGIAVVLGAAQAILLISSLSITTDLINRNTVVFDFLRIKSVSWKLEVLNNSIQKYHFYKNDLLQF